MEITISPEEMRAGAGPLFAETSAQLASELVRAATALAGVMVDGYIDKEAAAQYLGQSVRTVENWMRAVALGGRGLPHSKIGETVLFKRSRIDAWAISLERNTPPVMLIGGASERRAA